MNSTKIIQTELLKKKYEAGIFPILQEQKTRSFATLALTLVSLSLFGVFAINPTIATIIDLRKQLADNQDVSRKLEQKIADLSVLQEKYDALQPDLPLSFIAIPTTYQIPLLAGQIQALGQQNNMEIINMQSSPADLSQQTGAQKNASFSFTVDAQGTQQSAYSFISSLINFERVVTINTIILTKSTEASDTTQVHIKGNAYFKSM